MDIMNPRIDDPSPFNSILPPVLIDPCQSFCTVNLSLNTTVAQLFTIHCGELSDVTKNSLLNVHAPANVTSCAKLPGTLRIGLFAVIPFRQIFALPLPLPVLKRISSSPAPRAFFPVALNNPLVTESLPVNVLFPVNSTVPLAVPTAIGAEPEITPEIVIFLPLPAASIITGAGGLMRSSSPCATASAPSPICNGADMLTAPAPEVCTLPPPITVMTFSPAKATAADEVNVSAETLSPSISLMKEPPFGKTSASPF